MGREVKFSFPSVIIILHFAHLGCKGTFLLCSACLDRLSVWKIFACSLNIPDANTSQRRSTYSWVKFSMEGFPASFILFCGLWLEYFNTVHILPSNICLDLTPLRILCCLEKCFWETTLKLLMFVCPERKDYVQSLSKAITFLSYICIFSGASNMNYWRININLSCQNSLMFLRHKKWDCSVSELACPSLKCESRRQKEIKKLIRQVSQEYNIPRIRINLILFK